MGSGLQSEQFQLETTASKSRLEIADEILTGWLAAKDAYNPLVLDLYRRIEADFTARLVDLNSQDSAILLESLQVTTRLFQLVRGSFPGELVLKGLVDHDAYKFIVLAQYIAAFGFERATKKAELSGLANMTLGEFIQLIGLYIDELSIYFGELPPGLLNTNNLMAALAGVVYESNILPADPSFIEAMIVHTLSLNAISATAKSATENRKVTVTSEDLNPKDFQDYFAIDRRAVYPSSKQTVTRISNPITEKGIEDFESFVLQVGGDSTVSSIGQRGLLMSNTLLKGIVENWPEPNPNEYTRTLPELGIWYRITEDEHGGKVLNILVQMPH